MAAYVLGTLLRAKDTVLRTVKVPTLKSGDSKLINKTISGNKFYEGKKWDNVEPCPQEILFFFFFAKPYYYYFNN